MTDQELNAAIAEHCGWRFHNPDMAHLKHDAIMCWIRPGGSDWQLERVPNYAGDLNAMHEAEKVLYRGIVQQQYWQAGYGRFTTILSETCDEPLSATARQRAEAFVRTIGKWKD